MAMSIDTSTVFARFIGCLRWGNTREKVAYSGTLTPTRTLYPITSLLCTIH